MRSMGGCSKAEKNGSSIRKMAFLRKIPLCHHDSRKYRGCDADPVTLKFTLVSRTWPAGIERSVVLWYTISDDAAGLRHRMHGCFPCTERKRLCLL